CWTTTEAALTKDFPEDLQDAWERLRETAVSFGDQRIYASHNSIMFSRKSCYFLEESNGRAENRRQQTKTAVTREGCGPVGKRDASLRAPDRLIGGRSARAPATRFSWTASLDAARLRARGAPRPRGIRRSPRAVD